MSAEHWVNRCRSGITGIRPSSPSNASLNAPCSITVDSRFRKNLSPRIHLTFRRQSSRHLMCQLPIARETPKTPLRKPSGQTCPPAAIMRFCSESEEGFWSRLRSTALPRLETTARQSPRLATVISLPQINATSAVVPLPSTLPPSQAISYNLSVSRKPAACGNTKNAKTKHG